MKLVTFTCDMRPWPANHQAAVPDAVAERLLAEGKVKDVRPFPAAATAVKGREAEAPARPVLSLGRRAIKAKGPRRASA